MSTEAGQVHSVLLGTGTGSFQEPIAYTTAR
jgi:hypothetical protein